MIVKMKSAEQILREHGLEPGGKVQRYIDTEVVRLSDKFAPMRTGILKKALGTVYGSGKVKYNVPYAKNQYYHNAGYGKGGTENGGTRGRLWFERMKAAFGKKLAENVKRIAGVAKVIWRGGKSNGS